MNSMKYILLISLFIYLLCTEELLARVVEKLKGVADDELVPPIKAMMNTFLVVDELKKKEPDIDLKESIQVIKNMDKVEFRAHLFDGRM
jgi:hypothetical protein